jgi:heme-degrading monooxygenase HmoA
MKKLHLAQFNIGRMLGPLDGPVMRGFVERLDEINALADGTPGFVWRLQTDEGNATYLRPYDDDRVIVNMSVWETVEEFRSFVFESRHAELLRQRREWFESGDRPRFPQKRESGDRPRFSVLLTRERAPCGVGLLEIVGYR